MQDVILSVQDLEVEFTLRGKTLHAIRGISLDICEGESLAIVGESGSGKSVFCKTFMGLLDSNGRVTRGSIRYGEKDLAAFKTEKEWLSVRGKEIAMVMQDPMTSLNPLKTVGAQICEALTLHQGMKGEAAKQKATEILEDVGITEAARRFGQYPHEFSGGMRQRVVIAIAIACNPRILICDEPTTALDVTIQAQILKLLKDLKAKYKLTTLYITHDLGVVANVADRIAVMYAGDIVEIGTTGDRKKAGEAVAKELGIDTVYTQLLPADNVAKVEELLAQHTDGKVSGHGVCHALRIVVPLWRSPRS